MSNTATMNQAVDELAAQYKNVVNVLEGVSGLEATIRGLEGDVSEYKERAQNAEKAVSSLASRSDEDIKTIQVSPLISLPWSRVNPSTTDAAGDSFSRSSSARTRWLGR